jgi:5S rRNA maturation endonuclease (ribonuclease M5)
MVYQFKKGLFLYNGDRIEGAVADLIVVEGFPSVWWLYQHGYAHVVALMGSSASEEQFDLLVAKVTEHGRIWLFTDGDQAGTLCANRLLADLSSYRSVRWVKLGEGRQPTDCTQAELEAMLPREQTTSPLTPRLSARSIKGRLLIKEITKRQAIVELSKTFPSLSPLGLTTETWDAIELDLRSQELSTAGKFALQFILAVWDWRQEWKSGEFHVAPALDLWDRKHHAAFIAWATDPWFL